MIISKLLFVVASASVLLSFTSCTHKITRIDYKVNPVISYDKCDVKVLKFDDLSATTRPVGKIHLSDGGFSTRCNEAHALALLRLEACNIGADYINIIEEKKPDFLSSCYRCKAEFLVKIKQEIIDTVDSNDYVIYSPNVDANQTTRTVVENPEIIQKTALTFGFLFGGGSLLGADLEFLITKQFGFQIGAGIIGYGAGLNYHFKPGVRSSFLSLQYWNQGTGESFAQNLIGPNFVFRGDKWFTFQFGLGKVLSRGPAYPADKPQPPVILTYAIGAYLPF